MDARIVDGRKIARVTDDGKLKVLVHGRDGDDLVPVKVSEDGYLMLATDVTVEGVTVELGTVELNQGAPGQNPWPVTLSGQIVQQDPFGNDYLRVVDAAPFAYDPETDTIQVSGRTNTITVYERAVRTASPTGKVITIPPDAKWVCVQTRIYAVTGTFASGEGLRMNTGLQGPCGYGAVFILFGDKHTQTGLPTHVWRKGMNLEGLTLLRCKIANMLFGNRMQINVEISGTDPSFDFETLLQYGT